MVQRARRVAAFFSAIFIWIKEQFRRLGRFIERRPMVSFFGVLLILLVLIIIGSIIRKPVPEKQATAESKQVDIYRIGSAPKVSMQAQIAKSGVIKIVAQTSGVVSNIYANEGQAVNQGAWLVSLASNYQGGNAASVSRQLAQVQNKNINDTYGAQKELIAKQKSLAENSESNASNLRDIASKSIDDTNSLISLNQSILDTLNTNLQAYQATPSAENGANASLILSTKQMASQYQSAINQLQSAQRSTQYQADNDKPPAEMARLQKDITLKQLEIQEKTLEMSKEVSGLQVRLAQINEAMMYPSAPFAGKIERVHVRVGQVVNPGTPLVTISGATQSITAFAMVPADIAQNISSLEPSVLYLGKTSIEQMPTYISQEATDGQLYSVIYTIPQANQANLTDNSFVRIDIPVGYPDTGKTMPYVPIDAVYQTQDQAYLFVNDNGKATSRKVDLGNVFGRFVEIDGGLKNADQVIISRNVLAGDKVTANETTPAQSPKTGK